MLFCPYLPCTTNLEPSVFVNKFIAPSGAALLLQFAPPSLETRSFRSLKVAPSCSTINFEPSGLIRDSLTLPPGIVISFQLYAASALAKGANIAAKETTDTAKKIDMPPYILRFSLDDISHPPVELIFIQIT